MAYPFVKFPECCTSADKQLNVCSVHSPETFLNDKNHVCSRNICQEKITLIFSGGNVKTNLYVLEGAPCICGWEKVISLG